MMTMRIATFDTKPSVDPVLYEQFRAWMAGQPGMKAMYHVSDPTLGRYLSVSVWESREAVLAMKDRQFPGGPLGLKPSSVTLYDVESAHESVLR
jgi:heme-degrading monooxygenase HmoA